MISTILLSFYKEITFIFLTGNRNTVVVRIKVFKSIKKINLHET